MRIYIILGGAAALIAAPALAQDAPRPSDPAEIIKLMDTDKDGAISKEEWVAAGRREQRFARVDADGDGKVTIEELKKAMAAMQARQPQPGS